MDDLISEFLVETNESLEALDQDFVTLEQNPGNKEIIGNIFRVMHTIKGTCGFLGLQRLEKVAHAAENIMDKIRGGAFSITPPITSLILEANDRIKSLISHLEQHEVEPEGDDTQLIAKLNKCAETGSVEGASAPAAPPAASSPAASSVGSAAKTPDLDEEIDFTPVVASYVDASAGSAPKTPDLDQEIDFTPVVAPYAAAPSAAPAAEVPAPKPVIKTPEAKDEEDKKSAGGSGSGGSGQSIRVSIDVLENLMQMVGELVLTRNQLMQLSRRSSVNSSAEFATPLQRLNHITTELQEGVMKTRMQPIGTAWAKFPRLVRDLANDLGKKIELRMIGAETDLDRQMVEAIKDPLTHMIRNSADHGMETPDERKAAKKPEVGTVTLAAFHEGGHIIIKITDDGRGLNVDKIKAKAVANGLVTAAEVEQMSEKQIFQFIFKAGFSTAEKVTAVSGRGVGMDVVVSNITKIGGHVEVNSKQGRGSEFSIQIPLTLAIMPVLIIEASKEIFAIPQIRVSEIVRTDDNKTKDDSSVGSNVEYINGAPVLRLRGRLLPLVSLSKTLGMPVASVSGMEPYIVVCEVGSQSFGIMVDKVYNTEEIVVKPMAPVLQNLEVYSGCTILGDGSVIMILDPNGVVKQSGVSSMREQDKDSAFDSNAADEGVVNFLMFKSWSNSPRLVPLELVSRLEEVDVQKIEWSGDHRVVQYRGGLMRLIMPVSNAQLPDQGIIEVVVFADGDKVLGLVVESILDIVRVPMDIKSSGSSAGLLGSMVVNHVTCDLINVSYYFNTAFPDWLGTKESKVISNKNSSVARYSILLVDDSPFFRKFMKPVLVVEGYDVTLAESAAEGLKFLEREPDKYDLVISDIDMPEMNGLEFVKEAKENRGFSHIPFIALSSHAESDFGDFRELGFSGYVNKSERDNLIGTIRVVLSQNESSKEAA
jgi:two-component system, chemotaxis family, sensor kinase CheA